MDVEAIEILIEALVDAIDLTQMEDVIMELSQQGALWAADPVEVTQKVLEHPRLHEAIMAIVTEATTDYGR